MIGHLWHTRWQTLFFNVSSLWYAASVATVTATTRGAEELAEEILIEGNILFNSVYAENVDIYWGYMSREIHKTIRGGGIRNTVGMLEGDMPPTSTLHLHSS